MLFVILVATTGMREVSTALSNPFGDDEVDFDVQKYIHGIRQVVTMLVTKPILVKGAWVPSVDIDIPPTVIPVLDL